MSLQEKIALVTGGGRGIGRAVSRRLAASGAHVVINYVSRPDSAEQTQALIAEAGGSAEIVKFDISDATEVQTSMKQIIADKGKIDILVNNAGITRDGLIALMKEKDWDEVLSTNLKGAYLCTKAASRTMMKKKWGRIINITSVIGFSGNAGQANYAAAKSGLVGLSKSLAREYASRNITVNCVAPGYIETDMTDALTDEVKDKIKQEIPMGTLGSSDDIAGAVVFLAGEDANYITGQTIHVNGGMYM